MATVTRPHQARIEYPINEKETATATITQTHEGYTIDLGGTVIELTWPEYDALTALRPMLHLKPLEKLPKA